MAFRMQEEAKQLKGLFKDLVSLSPLLLLGWLVWRNQSPGHCESRLTLELPRSGVTPAMLIQRALKKMEYVVEMEMDELGLR